MDGYRELAQSVVLQAAQDLQAIYQVTVDLQRRDKAGTLANYVKKIVTGQKRKKSAARVLFPTDMLTAIDFFKDGNPMKDITYGLQGREGNSRTINEMRDYCIQNTFRLRRKITRIEIDLENNLLAQ